MIPDELDLRTASAGRSSSETVALSNIHTPAELEPQSISKTSALPHVVTLTFAPVHNTPPPKGRVIHFNDEPLSDAPAPEYHVTEAFNDAPAQEDPVIELLGDAPAGEDLHDEQLGGTPTDDPDDDLPGAAPPGDDKKPHGAEEFDQDDDEGEGEQSKSFPHGISISH